MRCPAPTAAILLTLLSVLLGGCLAEPAQIPRGAIDTAVRTLMVEKGVPGVAVVVVRGGAVTVACYGVASREAGRPVTPDTLFEIGSVSKTFTALLGAAVVERGLASLDDPLERHLPFLAGKPLGRATLRHAATYTAGGLPLQVPDGVTPETAEAYLAGWTPEFEPGRVRVYSNPSIAVFGLAAARAAGAGFDEAMAREVLGPLGLRNTFLVVPPGEMGRYAQGSTAEDRPIRMTPGPLGSPAYGVRTTARDMGAYLRAQINPQTAPALAAAIGRTHEGVYSVGPMTQALGWEVYPSPTALADLLSGNAPAMAFEPNPVGPRRALGPQVLFNKTGSTNGFAAYVLFVPARGVGVAILANRSLPIPDRVRAAWEILRALDPAATTPEPVIPPR